MSALLDPGPLLARRLAAQRQRGHFGAGLVKEVTAGLYGLTLDPGPLECDDGQLSVTGIISTEAEDHSKDVVVTGGIDTSVHEQNPQVLYEHGLKEYLPQRADELPCPSVGFARDPAGHYTVKKLPACAVATTYFHRGLKFAEQCYDLCRRGILKGLSLGFKPVPGSYRHGPVQGCDPDGNPIAGLLLKRIVLVEYTHCVLPDNPECLVRLAECVSRGTAAGMAMEPLLLKSLSAYAAPKRAWSRGADLTDNLNPATGTKAMLPADKKPAGDPTADGDYVELDGAPGAAGDDDQTGGELGDPGDMGAPELPGMKALREVNDSCLAHKALCEQHLLSQENEQVKGLLDEEAGHAEQRAGAHAALHAQLYRKHPAYAELGTEPDGDADDPPADDGEMDDPAVSGDADGGDATDDERMKKRLAARTERQAKRLETRQKRLEAFQARQGREYAAKHLKGAKLKSLAAKHRTWLAETHKFLKTFAALPHTHFTDPAKGAENHALFAKACGYYHKAVAEIGQETPDAPAGTQTAADTVAKSLTAERDDFKQKYLAALEENVGLKKRVAVLGKFEKDLAATRRLVNRNLAGGPR